MHISAPIREFSAPFSPTTVTHNMHHMHDTIADESRSHFVLQREETNHITYLTAGGSGDDSVHVSSVISPTQRSENNAAKKYEGRRSAIKKLYLLLVSVGFGAMTTRFFLPTNRKLILELPTYYKIN